MAKILIIEDDLYVRAGLKELLIQSNYDVLALEDGCMVDGNIKKFNPDLVICDIMMKKTDGYEVLEKLRKDDNLVPFIFLTAKCEIKDIRMGMGLGADDYIVKPYRAKDLLKAIELRLERHKKIGETYHKVMKEVDIKNKINQDSILLVHKKVPKYVPYKEIVYIKAQSEYSSIFLSNGEKYFIRKLLKFWEAKLPSEKFLRIHRSTIVNLDFIKIIESNGENSFIVKMKKLNEELSISQRYAVKIKKLLTF